MRHIGKRMWKARIARDNLVDTLVCLLRGHVLFRGKAIRVNISAAKIGLLAG